ncbi:MAG: hypothetical protein R3E75_07730 [Steroidobacteraceae bacterium]|nr:hypothetical protein [Nevskiaceae bacterium]MCP5340456.1 hypothetical protein [Nevskiaceae bacterium]MCP5359865.1 hypothetical protein [Nevskiaceae bacterium]MCP5467101.1 hypothetical protein [Nevskiaceae bacterium]MCP5472641.1 hypothetical protein [Nevskiaceae bacterium]
MRPFAVLLGIVTGSAVSVAIGLLMTLTVFLFLPEYSARVDGEFMPLLRALGATLVLAATAAASFYGELRGLRWRRIAQVVLAVLLVLIGLIAWPGPKA